MSSVSSFSPPALFEATNLVFQDDDLDILAALESEMANKNQVSGIKDWDGSLPGWQDNKPSNYAEVHEHLMDEYFKAPTKYWSDRSGYLGPRWREAEFERRFRTPRNIYDLLYEKITLKYDYLVAANRFRASRKKVISLQVKVTTALRMLGYASLADALEEILQIGESIALKCLREFCSTVDSEFEEHILRLPTRVDIRRIEHQFAEVDFRGFFGCMDCILRGLKLFPRAEHGITVGKDKDSCLNMEVDC